MINLLLSASTFFNEANDFIATRWAELLALVGGTSGLFVIVRSLFVLIAARIKKNNNVPINETITASIEKLKFLEDQLVSLQNDINNFPEIVSTQLTNALVQMQETKRKIFNNIAGGNENIQNIVAELPKTVVNVGLVEENTPQAVENIIVEQISENVLTAEIEPKEVVKKAIKKQRELL